MSCPVLSCFLGRKCIIGGFVFQVHTTKAFLFHHFWAQTRKSVAHNTSIEAYRAVGLFGRPMACLSCGFGSSESSRARLQVCPKAVGAQGSRGGEVRGCGAAQCGMGT